MPAMTGATCHNLSFCFGTQDCEACNAGRGSNLTFSGIVECDASVMAGDGSFGAVGAVPGAWASCLASSLQPLPSYDQAWEAIGAHIAIGQCLVIAAQLAGGQGLAAGRQAAALSRLET